MKEGDGVARCADCDSPDLIRDYEAGELVCEQCGYVMSSTYVDHGPEWRAFNFEQSQKRTRVGAPLTWTIHDKGLSTVIDWQGRDVHGRKLKPEQRAWVYRMRKWQRRSKVSGVSERNLAFALSELTKISYKLSLPKNILETASILYRHVVRKRLIRGRSIQGIAAATIYIACRQCNVIRNLKEVSNAAYLSKKELGRNYRFLLRRMQTKVPHIGSQSFVSKFASHLVLSGETERTALKILNQAIKMKLTNGRAPAGIAAAATYMASVLNGEQRTQGDLSKVAHVTEVTIRNRYKELTKKLNININM